MNEMIRELARQTDTSLYECHLKLWRAKVDKDRYQDAARTYAGQRRDRNTDRWSGTWEEVLECTYSVVKDYAAKAEAALKEIYELQTAIRELDAIYEQHHWSRFFLVAASNGHIHRSMNCHSCYPTTMYVWLPELSGLTDADAVAAEGEILCTFCFPDAPVAWTEGVGRRTQEEQDAKAAEKAAKAAAKAEKSLSLDGSTVSITSDFDGDQWHCRRKEFKTYRSAELWMVEALAFKTLKEKFPARHISGKPDAYSVDNITRVLEMMAEKKALTVAEILEALEKRVAKKVKEEAEYLSSLG